MSTGFSAAFVLAGLFLTSSAISYAQSPPAPEEELLGGPGAPITLRPPPQQNAEPPRPVTRKTTPAPVVKKAMPAAPKAAAKPQTIRPVARAQAHAPVKSPAKTAVAIGPAAAASAKAGAPRRAGSAPTTIQALPEPPVFQAQEPPVAPKTSPPLLAEETDPPILGEAPAEAPLADTPPVPDRQFAQIDRRIERAVRQGDLRPRTADALHDDLVDIADLQDEMASEGALREEDRDRIDALLDQLLDRLDRATTVSGRRGPF